MTFQINSINKMTQEEIALVRTLEDNDFWEITFPTLKKMMYEGDEEIPYYQVNEAMSECLQEIQNAYEHDDNKHRYLGIYEMNDHSLIIYYEDLRGLFRKVIMRPTWYGVKTFSQF